MKSRHLATSKASLLGLIPWHRRDLPKPAAATLTLLVQDDETEHPLLQAIVAYLNTQAISAVITTAEQFKIPSDQAALPVLCFGYDITLDKTTPAIQLHKLHHFMQHPLDKREIHQALKRLLSTFFASSTI